VVANLFDSNFDYREKGIKNTVLPEKVNSIKKVIKQK
jgi:hypothetical protein